MQLLEHIHVTVDSMGATEKFLLLAMPQLQRRGAGDAEGFGNWVHLGTEDCYIALTEVAGAVIPGELRHIGLVVDDIEGLMSRLAITGFQSSDESALDSHPHRRRVYYFDKNGLPWEFVQYLSVDSALRNDYSH